MERRPPSPLLSIQHSFRKGSGLAGLVALGTMFGCGAPEGDDEADVETVTDEIVGVNQDLEFKYVSPMTTPSSLVGDPAFCTPVGGDHSKAIFSRDTSNYIQGQSDVVGQHGNWAKYGSLTSARKLGGRPACGFLTGTSSPYPFVLLAKGANAPDGSVDKRLFWSRGNWTTTGLPPAAPAAVTPFVAIDATQYSTNGNPAVATHNGQLVVVYLKDNGQLAANYWTGSTFSPTLSHPNLPTGWTGVGTPTIAFAENWAGKFVIFVRAKNIFGTVRLYEAFFQDTHFTSAAGGPTGVYQLQTLPPGAPSMQSDPAYEYDNYEFFNAGTLYYRNGTTIYQASATNGVDKFSDATLKAIVGGGGTPGFTGNPAVIGGVPYELGRHWLLARGNNGTINFGESFNDEAVAPN